MAAPLQWVSLTAMGCQARQSTSLSLSFFICKMSIMTVPTPQGCCEDAMGWHLQSTEELMPKELICGCFHRRATSRTLTPSLTPLLLLQHPQHPQPCLETQRPKRTYPPNTHLEKPQVFIKREREGQVFASNAYWVLDSMLFLSIHSSPSSVYNLGSPGRKLRLREAEPLE